MFCPNCWEEIPNDVCFCPKCHTEIPLNRQDAFRQTERAVPITPVNDVERVKSSNKLLPIIICAIVLVLLIMAVLVNKFIDIKQVPGRDSTSVQTVYITQAPAPAVTPEPTAVPVPTLTPTPTIDPASANTNATVMDKDTLIADVQSRGVEVPDNIAISNPEGRYVTVYSGRSDRTTRLKSKPLNGDTSCIISVMHLPFNAYVYGTVNGWSLVKTDDGVYGYIYTPILGLANITTTNANARRGQGLVDMLKGQGVTIPDDFYFTDVTVGKIRNETGSSYYALNKYKSPDKNSNSYGKYYYYNSSVEKTYGYNDEISIYGYYDSFALYKTENGEFFWADATSFFKAT